MADLWEPVGGVFWSTPPWLPGFESIQNLGDSSFFVTVFGALAGAYFGAWAAQRNAERSKLRDELKKEIREVNSALVVTASVVNVSSALKKQYIKPLKDSYDNDCQRFETYKAKSKAGIPQPPFKLQANFLSLQELTPPIGALKDIVMGKLSATGRALAALSALTEALESLNYSITKRNDLMERIKVGDLPPGAQAHHMYFGIPYAPDQCNGEYGGYIEALSLHTDSSIFFGVKLFQDLEQHGARLAKKHKEKFGGSAPSITSADWSKGSEEGMIPKDEEYENWLSGFTEKNNDEASKTVKAWRQLKELCKLRIPH